MRYLKKTAAIPGVGYIDDIALAAYRATKTTIPKNTTVAVPKPPTNNIVANFAKQSSALGVSKDFLHSMGNKDALMIPKAIKGALGGAAVGGVVGGVSSGDMGGAVKGAVGGAALGGAGGAYMGKELGGMYHAVGGTLATAGAADLFYNGIKHLAGTPLGEEMTGKVGKWAKTLGFHGFTGGNLQHVVKSVGDMPKLWDAPAVGALGTFNAEGANAGKGFKGFKQVADMTESEKALHIAKRGIQQGQGQLKRMLKMDASGVAKSTITGNVGGTQNFYKGINSTLGYEKVSMLIKRANALLRKTSR